LLASASALFSARVRRTVALLPLCAFSLIYGLAAVAAEDAWRPALLGLGGCYLIGFLALASEWFWARWYASGLGWSGMMVGIFALVSIGPISPLIVFTVLHAAIVFSLKGGAVAALYEKRADWSERWGLDASGVRRLGKSVTRAAGSLPALIIWALGPRDPGQLWGIVNASPSVPWLRLLPLVLAASGIVLLVRARTAGILAIGSAAVGLVALLVTFEGLITAPAWAALDLLGWFGAGLAAAAVFPFVKPLVAWFRSP